MTYKYLLIILIFSTSVSFSNVISFFVKSPKSIEIEKVCTVEVVINKENLTDISKYEFTIPDNVDIFPIETTGSNFIRNKNTVKFIWLNMPSGNYISIKYGVKLPSNFNVKQLDINSKFFYIKDGESKHIDFTKTLIVKIVRRIDFKSETPYYSIQLGAYKNKLNKNRLKNLFPKNVKIYVVYENGLYKYRYGHFKTKDEAVYFVKRFFSKQNIFITPLSNENRKSKKRKSV